MLPSSGDRRNYTEIARSVRQRAVFYSGADGPNPRSRWLHLSLSAPRVRWGFAHVEPPIPGSACTVIPVTSFSGSSWHTTAGQFYMRNDRPSATRRERPRMCQLPVSCVRSFAFIHTCYLNSWLLAFMLLLNLLLSKHKKNKRQYCNRILVVLIHVILNRKTMARLFCRVCSELALTLFAST